MKCEYFWNQLKDKVISQIDIYYKELPTQRKSIEPPRSDPLGGAFAGYDFGEQVIDSK